MGRGTSLTRFTEAARTDLAEQFIDAYRARVLDALGDTSPYFYPFKRILLWASKRHEQTACSTRGEPSMAVISAVRR